MVHRRVKSSTKPPRVGNHNRSWIWGRNVVLETVRAGRWPMLELAVSPQLAAPLRYELQSWTERAGVPLVELDDHDLTQRCRAADHQGCAAMMGEFPYLSGDQLLSRLTTSARLIILDRIQDPFNFGAILRTVDGLGLDGVVIGEKEQTGVNSQVARSSAGAVNHVPIARVNHLTTFVRELAGNSWQIWGAAERGVHSLSEAKFQPPLGMIVGNEGTGIGAELLSVCTDTVRIPMSGQVSSLNAAVSAGILCYEVTRQLESSRRASS